MREACAVVKTRRDIGLAALADDLGLSLKQLEHMLGKDLSRPVNHRVLQEVERMAHESEGWGQDEREKLVYLTELHWEIGAELEQLRQRFFGVAV